MSSALDKHAELTNNLADTIRELASVKSALINNYAGIWNQTSDLSITERKETCRQQLADLYSEVATLEQEIEAIRAELDHLTLRIQHGDS